MNVLLKILGASNFGFLLLFLAKSIPFTASISKPDLFTFRQPLWYVSIIALIFIGGIFLALSEIIERLPPKEETEEEEIEEE